MEQCNGTSDCSSYSFEINFSKQKQLLVILIFVFELPSLKMFLTYSYFFTSFSPVVLIKFVLIKKNVDQK